MIQNVGPQFSQWDTGRSVSISDSNATHVHFANQGDSKAVIIEITDGAAKIPDYLFQTGKSLLAYAVLDGVTLECKSFPVRKRARPETYIYEETEVKTWESAVALALTMARESGEFKGEKGDVPVKGLDYYTEADKVEIVERTLASLPLSASAIITKAEGEYLRLTDSAAYPVQDLKLYVKATQSGEGDPTPTNIRAIIHQENIWLCVMDDNAIQHYDNTIALPENSCFGYIDYMRNKYVQTHKQLVLTGTENWASTWAGRACGLNIEDCVAGNKADKIDAVYCTHYTTTLSANIYNQTVDNAICTITNYGSIRIRDTGRLDVAVFKAYLAAQYAVGTPVTVIYKLATPIEHDLGELPEIATVYPTTIIPYGGNMTISYVADTKNYIDNKLNALATAIVANT